MLNSQRKVIMLMFLSLIIILAALSTTAVAASSTKAKNNPAQASNNTYTDNFSSYRVGSDGSPNWITNEMSWKTSRGYFINDLKTKSFAIFNSPVGSNITIETEVIVESVVNNNISKIAGTSIYVDSNNYWHLALVESPDNKNKKRYIELSEMLNGTWYAQASDKTKLTIKTCFGENFQWEYDHPYRLTITLNDKSISGSVLELDGTLKWKKETLLNNTNCIIKGTPSLTTNGFKAKFTNFKATIIETESETEIQKQYPKFDVKTNPSIKGKETGFFHPEKVNDKLWVIAPNGNAFWAVGTDYVLYTGFNCEALGYAPYGENSKNLYGSEEKWAVNTAKRLLDWGFNLLGRASSLSLRYRGLAHTEFLGFGNKFSSYGGDYAIYAPEHVNGNCFPNVFNPEFTDYCDKLAKKSIVDKNDPWLFGYFLDNELVWWGKNSGTSFGLTDLVIEKNKNHTAKIALIDWLKKKYKNISNLNQAWGTNYTSFDALANLTSFTGINQSIINSDKTDFEKIIIEKYFSITTNSVRKYDKNHMILGCRDAGLVGNNNVWEYKKCYDLVWTIAGKYTDISTLNYYGRVDLKNELAYNNIKVDGTVKQVPLNEIFQWYYQKSQKPMMITEWSFPAYDSKLPCTFGGGMRVNTQTERAKAYEIYQKTLFNIPFMVGSNYFMFEDPPPLGSSSAYPLNTNYGLVNIKDEPYVKLVNAAKETNNAVYDFH